MNQPTQDQKEAVKFFNPSAARSSRIKFDFITKWRGDHRECRNHRDGVCVSAHAWMPHASGRVEPDLVPVNIEENSLATIKAEGVKGAYPEPVWKAKGWLEPEDADGVRPSSEVLAYVIDKATKSHKMTIEAAGAKYEEVERVIAAFRARMEAANTTASATKGKGKSDG